MNPMIACVANIRNDPGGELVLQVKAVVLGVRQSVVGCVRSEEIGSGSFFSVQSG
jgi:hypothetical protein